MTKDIGGVWRTVGGRRIFIKDGQDLESAMKESGKFGNNNSFKKLEEQLNNIQKEIDKLENKVSFDEDNFDELIKKRADLQKQLLDEKAKKDKNYIQDKELRDFIYDYTNGEYRIACEYSQYLENGLNEKESFEKANYYLNRGIDQLSEKEFSQKLEMTKKLMNEINNQKETDKLLVRFEKTQTDEYYKDKSHQYKIGEEVNWGIRSTSSNENYFEKVMSGNDKLEASGLNSAYPYTYTEYRIIGQKKGLDISKYSEYKDQDEVLVKGKFVVKDVKKLRSNYVYDEKITYFKDWIDENKYTYEIRTAKSGNEIISVYDEKGKRIIDKKTDSFCESISDYYSYKKSPDINDIINGKVPYKKENILNKEKSTIVDYPRQVVTLEQIK